MHSDDIEIKNYPISRTNTAKIVGFNRLELLDREFIPWLEGRRYLTLLSSGKPLQILIQTGSICI
jgi:hypothetical protein